MEYKIESDELLKIIEDLLLFPYPQICRHTVVLWLIEHFIEKLHKEDPLFKNFCRNVIHAENVEAIERLWELRKNDRW